MSQYLLSMYYAQASADDVPADISQIMERVAALQARQIAAGAYVWGGGLLPAATARVVTAQEDDEPLITDGPYLETHEAMGGFTIIEADSPEEAARWAEETSVAVGLPIEVRAFN